MADLNQIISSFISYGLEKEFFSSEDKIYVSNELLYLFKGTSFEESEDILPFNNAVEEAIKYAKKNSLASLDNLNEEDNFEAKIIDCMLPFPSAISQEFWIKYKEDPIKATDWYYQFSKDTDYVKTLRLSKNIFYQDTVDSIPLDITINLSKPEKDPKEIAKLRLMKASSYPKCALCKENEGFYGSFSQAGRSNHRIIPLKLDGDDFFLQYSPYGYYNEHCIVLSAHHEPMEISEKTFKRFTAFLDLFPHYLLGSNADLPIVGGSILTHEHYQGGRYAFPLHKAEEVFSFELKDFPLVKGHFMKWPLSDLRVCSKDKAEIEKAATYILNIWRGYSDTKVGVISEDNEGRHNTITPIARKINGEYQIDLVLRNNRTDEENPDGIFHPHKDKHHIKKENIGLIEVMGLAILPGRLVKELDLCSSYLENPNMTYDQSIDKHLPWLKVLSAKYGIVSKSRADSILRKEVAEVFKGVLDDCGVFKQTEEGIRAAHRFISYLNKE